MTNIEAAKRLKNLTLSSLPKLKNVWHGGEPSEGTLSFQNLELMKVEFCESLNNLFPVNVAKGLQKLKELHIDACEIKEIVAKEERLEASIDFVFPRLYTLRLWRLKKLKSFHTGRYTLECQMLKELDMDIHQETHQQDGNDVSNYQQSLFLVDQVALRSIDKLELYEFPELKEIWHRKFPNETFSKLRELIVEKCDFVSNVISLELLRLLNNLEELRVGSCDLVKAIFNLESTDDIEEYHGQNRAAIHLRKLTVIHLPRLTNVWNKDSTGFFSFMNLQEIHVLNCVSLKYLFPASVAKGLERLKLLRIDSCAQMKEIVAMEEGIPGSTITINFVFPRVIAVVLNDLPELEHFHPGPHTIEWPKLKGIYTLFCGKLEIFTIDSINFHETDPEDDQQVAIIQQPMFLIEKVLPNIEALSLDGKDAMRIWNGQYVVDALFHNLTILLLQSFDDVQVASKFPYWFIQKIPNLKELVVKYSSFQEIFPCGRHVDEETQTITPLHLSKLCLWALPKLDKIYKDGFQLHLILEILETLEVWECSALLELVPSTMSFNHLTNLNVWKCNGMLHLLTSTTAKSLVQLEEMKIRECEIIEEIVFGKGDQGEVEIVLDRLENLELECLPSLINFCGSTNFAFNFPSLKKVIVRQCPKMQVFSSGVSTTPKLQRVKIKENGDEWFWEGSLNATIEKMSNQMVKVFVQPNYLQNFVQLTYNALTPEKVKGATLVVSGDGRYFSKEAIQIITKMAAANGVRRVWIGQNGLLSTPAVSAVIRERVGADGSKAAGAFILTASHNPGGPHEDFGIKYNTENGGPAPEAITDKIYENTKTINEYLIAEDLPDVDITTAGATNFSGPDGQFDVEVFDSATDYLKLVK
ncbi:Disease resistance protein [Quillaja saponaria]|uniref:Disease resistance protein n=1 Tax=Quillaja saponaria TaxID=32244 RepID=A0AAD7P5P7_QUISA|nr:Disease resistance protein [Quillaja saponaria]